MFSHTRRDQRLVSFRGELLPQRIMSSWRRTLILTLTALASIGLALPAQAMTPRERKIEHAVHIIRNQAGDPYVYGADGPNAFDCSGLTSYAFNKVGLKLPRTSEDQYRAVRHIPRHNARRGDFVFYHDSGGHVFHVAIIAGRLSPHGRRLIWHAPHTGTVVKREPFWRHPWYAGTKRLKR